MEIKEEIFFGRSADELQDKIIPNFRNYVRALVQKDDRSLEIGPAHSPILPKAEGYRTSVVDYTDADQLRAKYTQWNIDTSYLEPVDHIWKGGPISALLSGRFDTIIGSHVIEHMTDFVGFLQDCQSILAPDGMMVQIVPDKRYCFDFFQPITDVAKILSDHNAPRDYHSFEAHYRESAQTCIQDRGKWTLHWRPQQVSSIKLMRPDPIAALNSTKHHTTSGKYNDVHEYYFTPASFALIILELNMLGLTNLSLRVLTRSRACEFLTILTGSEQLPPMTMEAFLAKKHFLLRQNLNEIREQLDWTEHASIAAT
jgi:hypothetical protein